MKKDDYKVWINRDGYAYGRIELRMFTDTHFAKEVEFKKVNPGEYHPPCLTINTDTAQQFMDQLWLCGIRPTEGTGSAGSLKATQDHLEDMRKLAFHKIIGKERKSGVRGDTP